MFEGIYLDEIRTQKLIYAADTEEKAPLAFLCLTMFKQENCGQYIHQEDIDLAKKIFAEDLVEKVVDRWFIKEKDGSWTCFTPISVDMSQY